MGNHHILTKLYLLLGVILYTSNVRHSGERQCASRGARGEFGSINCGLHYLMYGQSKMEACAFACFTIEPDATTIEVDDLLAHCQSDAGSFKFGVGMQPFKHLKQLILVYILYTYTIVPYRNR